MGTLNLLEAVRHLQVKPDVVLMVGSAAAYGEQESFPTTEEAPFRPVSPYGCSKAAQDLLAYQYYRAHGLPIIRTRSYIHIGTRQGLHNAVQAFAHQVAAAEAGLQEPVVKVGNIETRRDILDVRDAVEAFWALIEKGEPGQAYNVCRGEAYRVGDLLNLLLRMSRRPLTVQLDTSRLRVTDPPLEVGSNAKLVSATRWKPRIAIEETLRWILDWRRNLVRQSAAV